MNSWITNWKKLRIKVKKIFKKQPTADGDTDWKTCPQCKKINYKPDLFSNNYICECSFHFDLPPKIRLDNLFDSAYELIDAPENINPDPLNFERKFDLISIFLAFLMLIPLTSGTTAYPSW